MNFYCTTCKRTEHTFKTQLLCTSCGDEMTALEILSSEEVMEYLENHAYLKKSFAKLSKLDIAILESFFEEEYPTKNAAMERVNRLFLDQSLKPKNWTTISELAAAGVTFRYQ